MRPEGSKELLHYLRQVEENEQIKTECRCRMKSTPEKSEAKLKAQASCMEPGRQLKTVKRSKLDNSFSITDETK